ncbi:MAG: LLM class flavin-dependent oxidoreductase [Candidatus Binatus sp.]|uniref:LLM class flavin-dependent oxidoreductase n=1 Tax=Candidatus Binatus sp. TaxID=2811406 RepID=UPI00271B2C8C|nr:LLM class flavin-dependent oxidoreductase [Candidatus Binatus sp.]MDO8434093.1 LLM class flavin-dependent oxidoreductase [Candidatus Binatus sp.]
MSKILTCTWAPTAMSVPRLTKNSRNSPSTLMPDLAGADLNHHLLDPVAQAEQLGIDYLLVAQRWWGTGDEIEGSTYDCLAMTAFYAARTERIKLVTAIHPGFFLPAPIAKWGATIDRITGGRWAINVTSGWHEAEFGMYGAELLEHDDRYARSREFIEILRGVWSGDEFSYRGRFYNVGGLRLEPRPTAQSLEIWQGGQSAAAIEMAANHSDWMFLNGGPPEKIGRIIESVRKQAERAGRRVRFALYSIPLCRATDAEAEHHINKMIESIDPETVARKRARTSGARGMWAVSDDPLTLLDTNEGFASRLIGSPATILHRMREFHALGVDCFHLTLHDQLFNREVLPALRAN